MRHKTGEGKRRKVRHKHRKDNLGSKTGKKNSKKLGKTLRPEKRKRNGEEECVYMYIEGSKTNYWRAGCQLIDFVRNCSILVDYIDGLGDTIGIVENHSLLL